VRGITVAWPQALPLGDRGRILPAASHPESPMTSRTALLRAALGAVLTLAIAATSGAAQGAPAAAPSPPAVGQVAPDFSLPGATRYGLLALPVRLSDFRGKTVVIAFFFQARTKG